MLGWRHSGFSAHNEVRVAAEDAEGHKKLAGYTLRAPMSLEKMTYDAGTAGRSSAPGVSLRLAQKPPGRGSFARCTKPVRLNGRLWPILLKNSKIFRAGFSAIIDFFRMFEVITMPKLTGGLSRRNRSHTAIPPFVRENNSLAALIFSSLDQKRSFSTE